MPNEPPESPSGMRLAEALTPRTATPAPSQWDEVGKGLMQAFVGQIQSQIAGEHREDGDWMDKLLKQMTVMKLLKEFQAEDRPSDPDKGIWTYLAKQSETQTELLKALLTRRSDTPDPTAAAAAAQDQFLKTLEVAQKLVARPSEEDNWVKQIGLQSIQQALTSDPLEGALRTAERVRELRGGDDDRIIDLDVWKAKQQFELERERMRLEAQREAETRKSTNDLMAGFAQVLRGPGSGGDAAGAIGGTPPGGLVRYTCHACAHEWVSPPVTGGVCPKCGVAFTVGGAPAPESPPPPPNPVGREAAGDWDGLGGLDSLGGDQA